MPVIEQEFDSAGNLTMTRMNVLGARGIEAVINVPVSGSATMKWLMVDGHGNVVRTMNTNFGLSAYQWRGVWGERQTGTLLTRKGYVANLGHQEDETGLIYMRARYYEPTTGRFISEDPARDGVNWYLYCSGNPVCYVDPDGNAQLPDTILANQERAELEASSGSGALTVGDLLTRGVVYGEQAVPKFLTQLVRRLGYDGDKSVLRNAIGKAIEEFKRGAGMRGADNIGVSANGIFITNASGRIIGFASDILYLVFLGS